MRRTVLLLASLLLIPHAALAQDAVADFYRGRSISLIVASTAGGGYDTYGRLIGRYLSRYIPGSPAVVVTNMTGAGGAVATSHIFNIAARDGTVMAAVLPGTITDPLYNGREKSRFDPARLTYLGSANSEVNMCYVRADAGVSSARDLTTKEVIIGAGQEGGSTRDQPAVQVNLLGHKLRIVAGYPGSREMFLAMEKNEVSGICGLGLPAFRQQHADWLDSGFVRILTQDNAHGDPKVTAMGVPRTIDLAKTPQDRQVMELIYSQQDFGRPYILPPGVPPARVDALRKAFLQALADKDLLAEADRLKIEITPVSGVDLQALVERIYATPPDIVERARQALTYRP